VQRHSANLSIVIHPPRPPTAAAPPQNSSPPTPPHHPLSRSTPRTTQHSRGQHGFTGQHEQQRRDREQSDEEGPAGAQPVTGECGDEGTQQRHKRKGDDEPARGGGLKVGLGVQVGLGWFVSDWASCYCKRCCQQGFPHPKRHPTTPTTHQYHLNSRVQGMCEVQPHTPASPIVLVVSAVAP